MVFVEHSVLEDNRCVLHDWRHVGFYVFRPENGPVAQELEEAHAIFYNVRNGTHFPFLPFSCWKIDKKKCAFIGEEGGMQMGILSNVEGDTVILALNY